MAERRKALSVRQPWAWLIVHGHKDVENRSWSTRVRGDVLIHAGKKSDRQGYEWVRSTFPEIPLPDIDALPRGGIVGEARIVDCVEGSDSPWFFGEYGFVFDPTRSRPLPFRPLQGQLYFFDVEPTP